jgi:hypothetical protein
MRSAGNFSPEWGYLAPAPSFARTARIVLVATAIGATAGAGVVLTLVDRSSEPQRTSVTARAIVTSVHQVAAPFASQTSARPMTAETAPVAVSKAPQESPPSNSPLAPSDVANQSPNHALVPVSQPADQSAAAPSTEANASAQAPAPDMPSENPGARETSATPTNSTPTNAAQTSGAPATVTETGANQPNSGPVNAEARPAAGVAASSEPSPTGTTADATDGGASAQEPSAQKKAKHHVNERAAFPGLGTLFRRFFVAHAARPNYSNR